jgi:hypothetical protein
MLLAVGLSNVLPIRRLSDCTLADGLVALTIAPFFAVGMASAALAGIASAGLIFRMKALVGAA